MMEFQLDQEWRLRPIKGDTGKTYIGMRDEDKVFIKRNTTPMLAALSREGIAISCPFRPYQFWCNSFSG